VGRLERLAVDKRSSLLRKLVSYGRQKFYNIGSRENLLDSVSHIGPLTTNPLEARGMVNRVSVDPQEIVEKKLDRKRKRTRDKRRRKNNAASTGSAGNNR
jgi:hypothetical protein